MKEITGLDFEKHILEIEKRIAELSGSEKLGKPAVVEELKRLKQKLTKNLSQIYGNLTPWQKAQIARYPGRPHCQDYIRELITDFTELSGDRKFADDAAMICGIGKIDGISVVVMGLEKGSDIESRIKHNFGMARPEGYRKAQRLMDMAHKFKLPIISFVDTSGAYPGVDAEERGQAEAIATSIEKSLQVKVPVISVIIGEGGSGGALAIATANKVLMLEHSIYSVISPEGCASILWRDEEKSKEATEALKLTAQDLIKLGVIDEIIAEPLGGAHRNPKQTIKSVGESIVRNLKELSSFDGEKLKQLRSQKFLDMGKNITE